MIGEIENIELHFLTVEDYQELKTAMISANKDLSNSYWKEDHIASLIEKFKEGQVVLKVNNQLAGCTLSLIVDYDSFDTKHTYRDITGDFTFDAHNSDGDVLYGIDVFIKPEFRGLRLGRRLYDYRKDLFVLKKK